MLIGLLGQPGSWAQGDLQEQIEEVTRRISQEPGNAELYLWRGELHRAHQQWDAAQADYDRVLSLAPDLALVHLARGRMFSEAGWWRSAAVAVTRFLEKEPKHPGALAVRARARVELGEPLLAAADYTAAIGSVKDPSPELYIARAQALTVAGQAHYEAALRGLDEGIKKLGPLLTLQLYAVDLEVKLGRFDSALERLEEVASGSPRHETWLARRGEILQLAGRPAEAREAYLAALQTIEQLPPSRQEVPAMVELRKRLREVLKSIPPPKTKRGKADR